MKIIKSIGKFFKETKTKILSIGKPPEEEVDYTKVVQKEVPKESEEKLTVQTAIETIGNAVKNTLSSAEHEKDVESTRGTPTPPPKMPAKKKPVAKKSVSKKPAVKKSETKTSTTKKSAPKKATEKKAASDKKTATTKTKPATTVKTEAGKKKATPKKAASKTTDAKTETAKKPVSKKPAVKKSEGETPATKTSKTKKTAPKKTTEKKAASDKKTNAVKTETDKKKATSEKAASKTSAAKNDTEKKTSKKAEKITLYAKDIKKHYGEVDSDFLEIIVKNLGPSIYKKDAELVSCSDPKELDTVRKNFLMKKLGIDASQKVLDAAIQDVCEELKATKTKYRATFYYSLAKKFKKESVLS